MKVKSIIGFVAVAFGLVPTAVIAQQDPVQTVVDSFYPAALRPEEDIDRHSCYSVYERASDGSPTIIVAGYTDVVNAAIRVLRADGSGAYTVAAETPPGATLIGIDCHIELQDVNGDGALEILLLLSAVHGQAGWIFQWTGSAMANMTPVRTEGDYSFSKLADPAPIDMYHDGTVQMLSAGDDVQPLRVYRLQAASYVYDKVILGGARFAVGDDPRANNTAFTLLNDSTAPFTLRVINGDRFGQRRVTGGSIRVNGTEVIGPSQLTADVENITASIASLPTDNLVEVTLSGETGSIIIVVIEDSTVRQ